MKKIIAILLICSMSLVVLPVLASPVAIDGIEAGDTVTYTVDEFQIPLDVLDTDIGDSLFALEGLQFDLAGSTIAVKVMQIYPTTNYYLLSGYFILGKAIEIPLNDDPSNEELRDVFGDKVTLPAGAGFGISNNIPGSDWLDNRSGVPFYLDPTSFDTVKSRFEREFTTVTVDTDLVVSADGEVNGTSITGTITWFGSGKAAGFLKSAIITVTNGTNTLSVGIEYGSIENIPLPEEVMNGDVLTFSMERAEAIYEVTDSLNNMQVLTGLNIIDTYLDEMRDEDVLRIDFKDQKGCFYMTDIDVYNITTGRLDMIIGKDVWFDGFTGMPTNYPSSPYSGEGSEKPRGLMAIIPLAPAITPDYKMWGGSVNTIKNLLQVATNSIPTAELSNLTDLGITVNNLQFKLETRKSGDLIYFYMSGRTSIDYINPNETDQTVVGTIGYDQWVTYTSTGLLAAAGGSLSVDLLVTNFPNPLQELFPDLSGEETWTGTLSLDIDLKIRNNAIDNVPDVSDARPVDLVSGEGLAAPGFPVVETLVVLTVAGIVAGLVFRKRKY